MRPFSFFDQDLLGGPLNILSIEQFLRQGLESATEEIVGAAWAAKSNLVVLDGFRGVRETAEYPDQARRFIYDVSNRLGLLGVTLLVTVASLRARRGVLPRSHDGGCAPLGLSFYVFEARERRTLEVLKARGTARLAGRHALRISDDGVHNLPAYRSARRPPGWRQSHANARRDMARGYARR